MKDSISMLMKLKVGVHGASGNVGKILISKINSSDDCVLSYSHSRKSEQFNSLNDLFLSSDVIIDFSLAEAVDNLLLAASKHKKPLVIGTTGLSTEQKNKIKEISKQIPILYSANFSIGANALRIASGITSEILGNNFEIGIFEIHRKTKKDCPSGTSLMIEDEIKAKSNLNVTHSSMRIADVFGEHNVIFENKDESIKMMHSVKDRGVFASGALKSAIWLATKNAGLYKMDDFLFSKYITKK
jgi:4-hydroxy-tetrahydrodipicolinate reductase